MQKISVIGAGFSGLSAACYAAKSGFEVAVYEKHTQLGGRARTIVKEGFVFDMGPSWYWMPDVFDNFFADFGKSRADYYDLIKLNPSFQIFYSDDNPLVIPAELTDLYALVEQIEEGSAAKLKAFLAEGKYKYEVAINHLIYNPSLSWLEFLHKDVIKGLLSSSLLKPISKHIRSLFKNEKLIALLEFPVLFLGAKPRQIPALYSLLNYSAFVQGTFYPPGGMHQIIEAMKKLALELGVKIYTNTCIEQIEFINDHIQLNTSDTGLICSDYCIASADYEFVERKLLPENSKNYSENYWKKKTFSPSCLIFYIGVDKKVDGLLHHNLFFDTNFQQHAIEIYDKPQWPENPLFYVSCPSKTDATVAPEGKENLFILIPVATGLIDQEATREKYFQLVIDRIEQKTKCRFKNNIVYKHSYCINDFITDYHAYGGNAYGLANTLSQTAVFKPGIKNKKHKNMFYTGQLTVPGPGVPPAIISGKIVVNQLNKELKKVTHETLI